MSIEALRKVVQNLDKLIQEDDIGDAHFSNPDYESYPLTAENLKEIKEADSSRKMAFVDGGNQEILGAPNFSVQINRIYFGMFRGGERILPHTLQNKIEFFSATHSAFRDDEIHYDTEIFPIGKGVLELLPNKEDLSFNSFDRTVTAGTQRADISRVASIARRFGEWNLASHVVENELDEGDILVADGSLESAFTNELKYLRRLYVAGKKKGIIITGLSKTSRLFTTSGLSLLGAVQQIAEAAPYGRWFIPLAKSNSLNHAAIIFAIKLHQSSERVFRYEVHRDQFKELSEVDIQEILSQLARNSRDISFPGYPYGLVDADTFGRVREEEVAHYQAILMSEISKAGKWKKFARHLHSIDAHDYLNMVVG